MGPCRLEDSPRPLQEGPPVWHSVGFCCSFTGPRQSPVLPSACCVGALLSDGRCPPPPPPAVLSFERRRKHFWSELADAEENIVDRPKARENIWLNTLRGVVVVGGCGAGGVRDPPPPPPGVLQKEPRGQPPASTLGSQNPKTSLLF